MTCALGTSRAWLRPGHWQSIARFRQAVHLAHVLRDGLPLAHYEPSTQ